MTLAGQDGAEDILPCLTHYVEDDVGQVDSVLKQENTMADLIDELSSQARALPPADRVRLAEELLATVHESSDEVEAAWDEEIRTRIASIDAGTAKFIPAGEVFAQVRRLLN